MGRSDGRTGRAVGFGNPDVVYLVIFFGEIGYSSLYFLISYVACYHRCPWSTASGPMMDPPNFGKSFEKLTKETVLGFLKDSKKSKFKI